MSELVTTMSIVISAITGGGIVGSFIALKKDRRDSLQSDLDYTKQFREIAQQEVKETRVELANMDTKVKSLETRVIDLEAAVRVKDRIISVLVGYIISLRDVLNQVNPPHPLPQVPDEVKDYIK